jgi:hypothetical protein
VEGSAMSDSKSKIPTAEEFERASKLMEERARNLDQVRDRVLEHFGARCPLHQFFILDQRDVDFRAYVFFEQTKDIAAMKQVGVDCEIVDFVYAQLERLGRGRRDEINVAFEFDSHEHVLAKFGGNYLNRLR